MGVLVGADQRAVGQHDLGRHQVAAGQPVRAGVPRQPAAQGVADGRGGKGPLIQPRLVEQGPQPRPPGAAQGDVLEQRDGVWSAAPEETKRRKARAALLLQQILERENAPGTGGSE